VHLVGFIIRIKRQGVRFQNLIILPDRERFSFYSKNKFEKLVHLVGFIIRIKRQGVRFQNLIILPARERFSFYSCSF